MPFDLRLGKSYRCHPKASCPLITQRSQVQILPPLQRITAGQGHDHELEALTDARADPPPDGTDWWARSPCAGGNAATESLFSLLQNNGPNRRCRSTREECHYSTVFRIQHSSLKLQQTPAAAIAPRTKPRGASREVVMPQPETCRQRPRMSLEAAAAPQAKGRPFSERPKGERDPRDGLTLLSKRAAYESSPAHAVLQSVH
jgi:hypothetical protein